MGMLLLIPGLDKILSHVSSLQTEDMVLLDVITSLGGQRVVQMYHIGTVRGAFVAVLITVHVQSHVTQSRVEHLPASSTECSYTQNTYSHQQSVSY